jgi:[ribosomal protein S5]-alanine N-acetyltransferase
VPRKLPQVELQPLRAADREEFVAAMRSSQRLHRTWISPPITAPGFDDLLERQRGPESDFVLVRLAGGGPIAGYFHLSQIVRGPLQSGFLGYGGVAAHQGRGYMTAGLQLYLRRAFTELRLHRLEANIQPDNTASLALVKRCGFTREGYSERYLKIGGRWRDHERWAIRAEQWRQGSGRRKPR